VCYRGRKRHTAGSYNTPARCTLAPCCPGRHSDRMVMSSRVLQVFSYSRSYQPYLHSGRDHTAAGLGIPLLCLPHGELLSLTAPNPHLRRSGFGWQNYARFCIIDGRFRQVQA